MARALKKDPHDLCEEERLLIRRLAGELSPAEAERLRLVEAQDVEFGRRAAAIDAAWRRLAAPPEVGTPDLAAGVLAQIRRRGGGSWGFGLEPVAVRAAAAAVLLLGVTLGLRLGDALEHRPVDRPHEAALAAGEPGLEGEELLPPAAPSLADAYWRALEEVEGGPEPIS